MLKGIVTEQVDTLVLTGKNIKCFWKKKDKSLGQCILLAGHYLVWTVSTNI